MPNRPIGIWFGTIYIRIQIRIQITHKSKNRCHTYFIQSRVILYSLITEYPIATTLPFYVIRIQKYGTQPIIISGMYWQITRNLGFHAPITQPCGNPRPPPLLVTRLNHVPCNSTMNTFLLCYGLVLFGNNLNYSKPHSNKQKSIGAKQGHDISLIQTSDYVGITIPKPKNSVHNKVNGAKSHKSLLDSHLLNKLAGYYPQSCVLYQQQGGVFRWYNRTSYIQFIYFYIYCTF